jgi:serine/threonine-protein kinase
MVEGDATGQRLLHGRYRIEAPIASGGMGTVFGGVDERLQRRVAVKLLRDDLASDPKFVERFRREARSVAALAHPNIATVFDYGEEDGRHFIVMELAEGRDLARVLREEGRFSPDRAVRIAEQICDALGHAHSAGVIHRDVKPANVIIGEQDLVKVTDFGIARAAGDSTLTATGSVLGSAHYISPEQANGAPATPASDLYSLGIVVYEMLTSALPFTGDSPVGVAMRHLTGDVPAPSLLNPDVPPQLDEVVANATAREPKQRYPTAAALALALQDALGDVPVGTGAGGAAFGTGAGGAAFGTGGAGAGMPGRAQGSTEKLAQTVWPIPGDRWDPRRLGRIVAVVFIALFVVSVALVIARLTSDDTPAARARRGGPNHETRAPAGVPSTETSPSGTTLESVVGQSYKDAERALGAAGFVVERNDVPSEDVEKDDVISMTPPAGSAVVPGETITLTVSSGEDGPKPVPPGHGGKVPPGHSKDKTKDKDKHD